MSSLHVTIQPPPLCHCVRVSIEKPIFPMKSPSSHSCPGLHLTFLIFRNDNKRCHGTYAASYGNLSQQVGAIHTFQKGGEFAAS